MFIARIEILSGTQSLTVAKHSYNIWTVPFSNVSDRDFPALNEDLVVGEGDVMFCTMLVLVQLTNFVSFLLLK